MSARGRLSVPRLIGTVPLPRRHPGAAWILAIAGPLLIALLLLPFRSSLELSGFLSLSLLGIVAVALIGGVRPALTADVAGVLTGAFFFASPIYSLGVERTVDVVALVSFAVVAGVVGVMADSMRAERDAFALLAEEQGHLRVLASGLRAGECLGFLVID